MMRIGTAVAALVLLAIASWGQVAQVPLALNAPPWWAPPQYPLPYFQAVHVAATQRDRFVAITQSTDTGDRVFHNPAGRCGHMTQSRIYIPLWIVLDRGYRCCINCEAQCPGWASRL